MTTRAMFPISIVLVSLLFCGCGTRTRISHSGQVVNDDSGEGIKDAIVSIRSFLDCRRINIVEAIPDIRELYFRETRTDPKGNYFLGKSNTKVPFQCRLRYRTTCFKPGYFPVSLQGRPSIIRLRPMRHYLDFLSFRHPREYYPGILHARDVRQYRMESNRLVARSFPGLTSRFRNSSHLFIQSLERMKKWRFRAVDAPGVFLQQRDCHFNRLALGAYGKYLLVHDSRQQCWFRVDSRFSLSPLSPMGRKALLPARLPMDIGDPFPMAVEKEIRFRSRFHEKGLSPVQNRADRIQSRKGEIQSMAWGHASVLTIEGNGNFICHYGTAAAAGNFYGGWKNTLPASWPRFLKAFTLDDFPMGKDTPRSFAFVLSGTHGDFIVISRSDSHWWIHLLSAGSGGKARPMPLGSFSLEPEITAAALGNALYLGFRNATLRSFQLPFGSRKNFREDQTFYQNSREVLPAPPVHMVMAAHLIVACGNDRLYRFGLLGIPDRLVNVDPAPTGAPDIWSRNENISLTPLRSVERSGSEALPGIRAIHPDGKTGRHRIQKKPPTHR